VQVLKYVKDKERAGRKTISKGANRERLPEKSQKRDQTVRNNAAASLSQMEKSLENKKLCMGNFGKSNQGLGGYNSDLD